LPLKKKKEERNEHYLNILNREKCHLFSFTKSEKRRMETGPAWVDWYQWQGGRGGERA
jgi:hypothetical protein